jgi:hypothetical protein
MFPTLFALIRSDIRRQVAWLRTEAKRQSQSVALTAGFAVGGALALIGTIIIGLMALYTWAEMEYGPLIAFAIVGATTGAVAIILFCLAFLRPQAKAAAQPAVRSADPAMLKNAVTQDLSHDSAVLLETLKRSSIGPAVTAGENALKTGEQAVRFATNHLRGGSRPSLLATLGVAAVVGLVLGRRI